MKGNWSFNTPLCKFVTKNIFENFDKEPKHLFIYLHKNEVNFKTSVFGRHSKLSLYGTKFPLRLIKPESFRPDLVLCDS